MCCLANTGGVAAVTASDARTSNTFLSRRKRKPMGRPAMNTTADAATITTDATDHVTERRAAANTLYAAETALHTARQTGVDSWVKAAGDRLHDAVVRYEACCEGCINVALSA